MSYIGAIEDPRGQDELVKDWQHEEVLGMGAFKWEEKPIPKYTIRNQDGSYTCGGFSGAKVLSINNLRDRGQYVDLDPNFIYQKRINKTSDGMFLKDLLEIMCKHGAPEDRELKMDNKSQPELDKITYTKEHEDQALQYRAMSYVPGMPIDMDEIARVISLGHTPIGLVRCNAREWTVKPQVIPGLPINVSHFVPFIAASLIDGEKTLVVDDSWGTSHGRNGQRFITENFLKQKFIAVGYCVDLNNNAKHKFTTPLRLGMRNNQDVRALQDRLKQDGFLNKNIPSTGNYLQLTAQAVYRFQVANNIAPLDELNRLGGRTVGPKTLQFLNK